MSTEDKIAEAYERGFFVATARAKNRVEQGLPIGYDDKPDAATSTLGGVVSYEMRSGPVVKD